MNSAQKYRTQAIIEPGRHGAEGNALVNGPTAI